MDTDIIENDYDPVASKFCSSLLWFVCRLSENGFTDIPADITNPLEATLESMCVKASVIEYLSSGSMYLNFANIYLNQPVYSLWDLIQRLSHNGIYVMDERDDAVTDQDLTEKFPFKMTSHLSLMDSLMLVYSNHMINIPMIVHAIRTFTSYNASKELPFDLEDSLLLWLNKINHVNTSEYSRSLATKLAPGEQHRIQLHKHKLVEKRVFPLLSDICECFKDGITPLSLILFYMPNNLSIDTIKLSSPLTMDERFANIELFRALCAEHICTSVFAIPSEDFFHSKEVYKQNFIALLSEMFIRLEDIKKEQKLAKGVAVEIENRDDKATKYQETKSHQPLLSKRSKQQLAKLEQASMSQEHTKGAAALQVDDLDMFSSQMVPSTLHRGQLQYASHAWEGNMSSAEIEKNKNSKISLNFRSDSGSSFRSGYRSNESVETSVNRDSQSMDRSASEDSHSVSSSTETYIVTAPSTTKTAVDTHVEDQSLASPSQNNLSYSDGVKLVENALISTLNKQTNQVEENVKDFQKDADVAKPVMSWDHNKDHIMTSSFSNQNSSSWSSSNNTRTSSARDVSISDNSLTKSLHNQASLSSIYSISSLSDEFSDNLIYQQNPAYSELTTDDGDDDDDDDALSTITEATEPEAPSLYSFHSSSTSTVNESGDEHAQTSPSKGLYKLSPSKGSFTLSPAKGKLEEVIEPEEVIDDDKEFIDGFEFPAHMKGIDHILTSSLSESTETLEDGYASKSVRHSSELDKTLTEEFDQNNDSNKDALIRGSYAVQPSTEETRDSYTVRPSTGEIRDSYTVRPSTEENALAHGLPIISNDDTITKELKTEDRASSLSDEPHNYRTSSEELMSDVDDIIHLRYPSENSSHSLGTHSSSSGIVEDDGRIHCMSDEQGRVSHTLYSSLSETTPSPHGYQQMTPSPHEYQQTTTTSSGLSSDGNSVIANSNTGPNHMESYHAEVPFSINNNDVNRKHSGVNISEMQDPIKAKIISSSFNEKAKQKSVTSTTSSNKKNLLLQLDAENLENNVKLTPEFSDGKSLFGQVNVRHWPFVERNNNKVKNLNGDLFDELPSPVKTSWQEIFSKQITNDVIDIESEFQKVRLKKNAYKSTLKTWKDFLGLKPRPTNESRDEPLSSRLAALRMQLEEKRRQFEEEKKRKQQEWSQERGKMLTSAYLRMNGKENEDPELLTTTGLTSWEVHFDETPSQSSINKTENTDEKTAMTSPSRPYMSPREYIRQKQLEQKLDQSPTKEGLWFVDLSNDNMTSPIDHAQRAFLFDSTRKFSEQQGNSPLQTPHNSQQQQRQVNEQQRQTKEENPPQEECRKSSDSLTRLKALRDVTSEHSGHVNRHATERSDHVTLQRSSLSQVDSLQNEVNTSQDEVSRSYRYNKSFSHEERPSIEDSSQRPVTSNVRPINSVPNTPSQVPITRNFDFVSQPDLSRSSPVQPFTTPSLTRNFENMNLYDETNGTVSHVGDNDTKHFSRHYDGDNGSLNTSYNYSGDRANISTHEQYKGDNACSESYHHLSYGMSEEYRQNNPTEYQRLQHERNDENRLKESTGYHQLPHLIMERSDQNDQKESAGYHQLPHLIMERTDEDNKKESAGYHQLPHLIMERTDLKESTGYHQLPHLMERSDENKVSTHDVHISPVQNGAMSPSEPTSTTHHVFDRNYVENVYNQDEGSINTVNAQQLEQRDSLKSQQSSSTNKNAVSDHMEQIIYDHPPLYTNEESTHAHNEFDPREQQSHLITNNSVDSTHARNEFHTLDQESPMVTNRSVVSIETYQPLNSEIYVTESCSKDENSFPPAGNVQPPLQQLQFSTPTKNTEVLPLTSQIDEAAVDLTKTPSDKPSAWALNFGDEFQSPEMTPEQKKKRDRFIRNRQKKLEEERAKKEAEQEKKRRKEQLLAEQKEKEEEARMRDIERQKEAELEQATSDLQHEFYAKRLHEMTYQTNTPERQLNRPLSHRVQARETGDRPTHPRVQSANAASPNRRFGQGTSAYGGSTEHLPSQFFEYKGPSAYQKPSGKSNRKIIQNAITHCCLCGEVNKDAKTKCLEALSESEGNHFLVLFREGLKFRSVYEYHPEAEIISRIYGIGPKTITTKMIAKYFKYNSGGKEFNELDTKHLSIQIDGVMIKKELWEKKNTPSKTNSNVARKKSTPRSGVNR